MKSWLFRILLILIISGLAFIGIRYFSTPLIISQENTSPITKPSTPEVTLSSLVSSSLVNAPGRYGIYIKHLSTGETYSILPQDQFTAASLYKLWVMAAVYERIQSGSLARNTTLSQTIPYLNRAFSIPDSAAELTSGTITMSLEDALSQTITVSGNYSAMLLSDYLKSSQLADYLKRWGFTQSRIGTKDAYPLTSAYDMGLFLELLYKGRLANPAYTTEMIALLTKQQRNEKLPSQLPPGTVVAHKTGEIDSFSHDAGIVYTDKGDYIIVILSETASLSQANKLIGSISKAVYDYFTVHSN